jgi:uncharacterized Zn-finger protein
MDISLTTNLTPNASCLQNNQQQTRNIDTVIKNSKRFYPCPVEECPKIFSRNNILKNHILIHNNKREYPCDTCGKRFNTESGIRDHKTTHRDKTFICYICDRSFVCKKNLTAHNKTQLHNRNINNIPTDHSPYKPDPCITDAKNYSVEVAMKEQSRLNHESQNIYQDNNKPNPLKLLDNKMACAEQDINDDTMLYITQVTQKTNFLSYIEEQFNENILFDAKQNPDKKDIEPLTAGFPMGISLTTNLTSNASCLQNNQQLDRNIDKVKKNSTQSKTYPCTFEGCTRILTRKETLDYHMLAHYNEQKYPCNKCNKTFNTNKALKQHEQTHESRKFLCNTCNIAFKRKEHLQKHNNTQLHILNINNIPIHHSPYKPDPCITDDKSYSIGIVTELHSRLNPENQDVYQDNNNPDSLKLPDNTMIYAESAIQEEDCLSDIEKDFNENNLLDIEIISDEDTEDYSSDTEKYFNENNLLDIEISSNEDIKPLTAGLNYDKIVTHYL